jgi:diguanylate cyclase (GGDEF)-like protein/PAS domain S-box-containing protein
MKAKRYLASENLVDLLLDAICVVDRTGKFVFVSAACERIFGYCVDEMIGRSMIDMVHPADREVTLQTAADIMSGDSKPHFENRYVRKDGRIVHILWSARWSEDDQVRIAVAHDISERKRAESLQAALYAISEATHLARDLAGLFQRIHLIICDLLPAIDLSVALHVDGKLSFPFHSKAAPAPPAIADAARFGEEVIHRGETLLLSSATLAEHAEPLRTINCDSRFWLGVPLHSHKGILGAMIVQREELSGHYSETDKELLQFVSIQVATAIERQQLLGRLQLMAQYDQLTQLPNRELLHDRLHIAIARARRDRQPLALLFLDLDKFKQVNDTWGHATGDLLLQLVAQRLSQCVREVDTVARFAGDEFVVLLEDFHAFDHAVLVAEKIRLALNQPFDLRSHSQAILPSIGIALYPKHAVDPQQLLNHADNAMYLAKKDGGNRYHLAF